MTKILTDPHRLMAFLPNAIQPAPGDRDFFDKLLPYIRSAERWADCEICPLSLITDENQDIRRTILAVVAPHALHEALAMLDIVVTPNGLGVVSTETVAPASRMRSDAAAASLIRQRDSSIRDAVDMLRTCPQWLASDTGRLWGRTLFPDMSDLSSMSGGSPDYAKYLYLKSKIMAFEDLLAERFVSPELMTRLRNQYLSRSLDNAEAAECVRRIRSLTLKHLLYPDNREMKEIASLVDFIRDRPYIFPEWPASATSRRFSLPGFSNDRNSSGFFF